MRRAAAGLALVAALAAAEAARAGMRARYGGTLRAILPCAPQAFDPALAASAADLVVARLVHACLVNLTTEGALQAELLAAVPEAEAQGRLFRMRLRPGARFQDGSAVGAQDVVASLSRLLDPALGSPFAVLALPLVGAQEPSKAVAGLTATGELELQASLAFAYPDWMRALAHPSAAVLPARSSLLPRPLGAGPFAWAKAGPMSFVAFPDCAHGRPFADALRLSTGDARNATRALALGEADLSAVPVAERASAEGPALFTSYLALNPRRLGERAARVRRAVEASIDVADLTRTFVRAPAQPLLGLLPPLLDVATSASARAERAERAALSPGTQLVLISDAADDDHRAVGERLQVKLHDAGVGLQIRRLARAELRGALARGEYDLALVSFAAIPEPGMALAQLVLFGMGRDAAREVLRAIGAGADPAARRALASMRARELRDRLPLIPLYVQAPRILSRPGVAAVGFDASGAPALADAWFEPGRGLAPAGP
jgi:ABC-type transport system substrate-binding protein